MWPGVAGRGLNIALKPPNVNVPRVFVSFLERGLAARKQILRRQPQHVLQLLRVVLLRALSSHRNRLLHLVRVQHHNHHVVLLLCIF